MSDTPCIRVMIVDDQAMVRRGLALVVGGFEDMTLVSEAANAQEAITRALEIKPDVILMDLIMPQTNGIEAARTILEQTPDVRILALTSFADRELVESAMQVGMIGYMLKDSSVDELADAIRAAYRSKPTIAWEAAKVLIGSPKAADVELSEREQAILALMANGLTNRQVALQLAISPYTVNAHVRSIFTKLNVNSRTEAVLVGIQKGIISK